MRQAYAEPAPAEDAEVKLKAVKVLIRAAPLAAE